MSDGSAIQWTDTTWNPTTGCTKVSPGCAHCYIERTPPFRIQGRRFERGATDLRLHPDRLLQPLRWKEPRRVFVNSLSDLFHPDVPAGFIGEVFAVMGHASRHQFQVLTKRAERMLRLLSDPPRDTVWPLPNVWLGVSVENQHFADERIPLLLQTPAAVRFISAEPLLGPVTLAQFRGNTVTRDWLRGDTRLDWVIVGGESGPSARPFDLAWARSIIAQCRAAGVPVFVKQLGRYPRQDGVYPDSFSKPSSLHDKKGGDPAEWPEDLRVREFPAVRG